MSTLCAFLAAVAVSIGFGCARSPAPNPAVPMRVVADAPEPGVSRELALRRARRIADVRYEIELRIPDAVDQPIEGSETVRFTLSDASAPLVLDFQQPPEKVRSVRVAGEAVAYEVLNGHIVVPAAALGIGENAVAIEFLAGDGPLNRNPDFLYTLFVPGRASEAIPTFDQPDLKARWTLTLDVPSAWNAVANGAEVDRLEAGARTTYRFGETEPISSYLFAFVAGRFEVETAMRDGRRLRMFHRETDTAKVARNREAIFDLHATALAWLEEYTGIPYPFGKFDFVLIPSFQYGGMEHPGQILYRAGGLMLDESATQGQLLGRASVIAHETAHMWFGDLVTMEWFDDVWTKEVFANFMAAKIVHPSFPEIDHDLRFLLAHHPGAYGVDRTAGANPIGQELQNLRNAGSLYGAIIYEKAPIVMRKLEEIVGTAAFRDGLREYLESYSYGNATWDDLVAILDRRSPEDLTAWSTVWVEEPGRPVIETTLTLDDAGRIASLSIAQSDPRGEGRVWPQALRVRLGYGDTARIFPVVLDRREVRIDAAVGLPAPDYVLPNSGGLEYGHFRLDPRSRAWLLEHLPAVEDDVARGAVWLTFRDAVLEGDVAPGAFLDLAARALPAEDTELLVQRILSYATDAYWRLLPAAERRRRAPALEALLWQELAAAEAATLKAAYFGAYRRIALTDAAVERLERIWRKKLLVEGLTLSEPDYTDLAQALAVRAVPGWERILADQQERIENPDRRARFAFVVPALSADPAVRDSFFASLAALESREHEPWVIEGVGWLHHPLRARTAVQYIRPSLELLEEIRRTGDIFFPKGWLDATLGGHNSAAAAEIVREFLDARPDFPADLCAKILQSADGLFRAAAIVEDQSDNQ